MRRNFERALFVFLAASALNAQPLPIRGLGRLAYQDVEISDSCAIGAAPRTFRLRPGEVLPPMTALSCSGGTLRVGRAGVTLPLQTVPGALQGNRILLDGNVTAGFDLLSEWSASSPQPGQLSLSARMSAGDTACEDSRSLAASGSLQVSRVCEWNGATADVTGPPYFILETDLAVRGAGSAAGIQAGIRSRARYEWITAPVVDRVEFVQSVQSAEGTVPLFSGKHTQARVLVKGDGSTLVRARFVARYKDGAFQTITPRAIIAPASVDRGSDRQSFTVPLPAAATQPGAISVDVDLLSAENRVLSSASRVASAEFIEPARAPSVGYLLFCEGASPISSAACPKPIPEVVAGLDRTLPVSAVRPRGLGSVLLPAEQLEQNFYRTLLRARNLLDELQPAAPEMIVGALPSAGVLAPRWAGKAFRSRQLTIVADGEAAPQQAFLGASRLLGVDPATMSASDSGFDAATGEVVNPGTRFWPGSASIRALDAALRVREQARPLSGNIDFLHISGAVRRDGSAGSLGYGFRTSSNANYAPSDPTAPVCIVLTDSGDASSRYCFPLDRIEEAGVEDSFAVRMPWLPGARRAALLVDGREVASRILSATPPVVELLSPITGNRLPPGPITIIWRASDLDGDPLRCDVMFSPDGGLAWLPLALDFEGSQLVFDPSALEDVSQPTILVRVSDGLHNAVSVQGPLTLTQEPSIEIPRTINAPDRPAGQTAEVEVPVSNKGTGPAILQNVTASGVSVELAHPSLPAVLPAGVSYPLRLRLQPPSLGAYSSSVQIAGLGFDRAALEVRGRGVSSRDPEVSVSLAAVNFGDAVVGRSRDVALTINNSGGAILQLTGVSVSAPFRVLPAENLSVTPGGQLVLPIRFESSQQGYFRGVLTLESNDRVRPTVAVPVTGNAVIEVVVAAPRVELQPAPINFGSVRVGETKDQSFTIRNSGDAPLVVSRIQASPSDYTVPDLPALPITLAPGAQRTFTLRLIPQQVGTRAGGLQIVSNDPVRGTLNAGLTAQAAQPTSGIVVLAVDDGTFESSAGFPNGDGSFVNRLTPPAYPATLRAVRLYFGERGLEPGDPITILSGSHPSGGEELTQQFRPRSTAAAVRQTGTFVEYTLPPLTIESGDFVVGFTAATSPTLRPAAVDVHNNLSKKAFASRDGATWRLIELWPGLPAGVFGIRAVVDLGPPK